MTDIFKKIEKTKKDFSIQAKEIIRSYNLEPEGDLSDVDKIDFILKDIHNNLAKTDNYDGIDGLCAIFGMYVSSILVDNFGGQILVNHQSENGIQRKFEYHINGINASPYFAAINSVNFEDSFVDYIKNLITKIEGSSAQ